MTPNPVPSREAVERLITTALLQAFEEHYGPMTSHGKRAVIARAAELTQVPAQSFERASPAKDGGEQDDPAYVYAVERNASFLAEIKRLRDVRDVLDDLCSKRFDEIAELRASQMPAEICGRCGKPLSELCGDDFMPMRPQSAVQGWIPTWAWRQAFGEWFGGKLGQGSFHRCFDSIESRARELAAAPQPPQGEGA